MSLNPKTAGTIYGLVAAVSFSITLPATRAAVTYLHPAVVGLGRPVAASILAWILLMLTGQRFPDRCYWKHFLVVVLGCVVGFPLLTAWAMHTLPAAHGAITLALLPLATAAAAALRAGERPSIRFWAASVVGSAAVLVFAEMNGAGSIRGGDLILLLAVVVCALGYAEGARLGRVFTGWQVISWALVMGGPFLAIPLVLAIRKYGFAAPASAWLGFAYIVVVSQFVGLFAWYKGLVLGGIARVGQLQLLQPFCTILFSALVLGESVSASMIVTSAIVVACVAIGRKAAIGVRDFTSEKRTAGAPQAPGQLAND